VIRSIARTLARSRTARAAIGAVAVAEVTLVIGWYGFERAALWRDRDKFTTPAAVPRPLTRKVAMPGLERPPAVAADGAGLADDEEVIGVVVDGRPRAYRLKALEYPPWHIVNDVIGGTPLTVAHCDLTGCTRVYSGPEGMGPLDVAQAGLVEGEMVVTIGGRDYLHRTGRALDPAGGAEASPFSGHAWTRTTWREWVGRHPTTDVFVAGPHARPSRGRGGPSAKAVGMSK
jgi:hypothetical protein